VAREGEIIQLRVPGLAGHLAAEIAAMVAVLRDVDLKKPPSVAESVDWARTLLALGADRAVRRGHPAGPCGPAEVPAGHRNRAGQAVAGPMIFPAGIPGG